MTNETDRIQNAIRHIQTSADIDPWAMEIAVDAMRKQIPKKTQKDLQPTCNQLATDTISRQDAIDALSHMCSEDENGITVSRANVNSMLRALPSAEPEQCEYAVNALAVEEMLKDLLPERGMWEIEGDEAKTAICEVVRSALEGLWKLPFVKPDSKESSLTQKALDTISSHSEKQILEGCIALIQEMVDGFREYLDYIGHDEPEYEEEKQPFQMSYFHIVNRLFLWHTSHSGGTSTRAKCCELGIDDSSQDVEFYLWEDEQEG